MASNTNFIEDDNEVDIPRRRLRKRARNGEVRAVRFREDDIQPLPPVETHQDPTPTPIEAPPTPNELIAEQEGEYVNGGMESMDGFPDEELEKRRGYLKKIYLLNENLKIPDISKNKLAAIDNMTSQQMDTLLVSAKAQLASKFNQGVIEGLFSTFSQVVPVAKKKELFEDLKNDALLNETMKFWLTQKLMAIPEGFCITALLSGHVFNHLKQGHWGFPFLTGPSNLVTTTTTTPVEVNQQPEEEDSATEEEVLSSNT